MGRKKQIHGLEKLGQLIKCYLAKDAQIYNEDELRLDQILRKSQLDNPWFILENQRFALSQWASEFSVQNIENWVNQYSYATFPKKVGLVLAGNIPMVGFHDVVATVLSGHIPVIKLSSKDRFLIPFLLNQWNEYSDGNVRYYFVNKLESFDAVIATGRNNTARYLKHYFQNSLSIIRKNRTSVAVLKGNETNEDLQLLAEDIFRYFGLGCRNVTRLFIPQNFSLDRLFENFMNFKEIINHNKYANNYDYNRAVYLLNQEKFWDNNFVLLREDDALFSPLAVLNFSRYHSIGEVQHFLQLHQDEIQCVVANQEINIRNSIKFGEAQNPSLSTYADNVNTMQFLEAI